MFGTRTAFKDWFPKQNSVCNTFPLKKYLPNSGFMDESNICELDASKRALEKKKTKKVYSEDYFVMSSVIAGNTVRMTPDL